MTIYGVNDGTSGTATVSDRIRDHFDSETSSQTILSEAIAVDIGIRFRIALSLLFPRVAA